MESETRIISSAAIYATRPIRLGIHPRIIYQLRDEGLLEDSAKGVYRLVEIPDFSEPDLVLVFKKIPKAIICLISATKCVR